MKSWHLYLAFAALFAVGLFVVAFQTSTVDEFSKAFTPYVAAISALLAAAISYANLRAQGQLSKELEDHKTELQGKLETVKGEILRDVERLKAELVKDVEAIKTSLAAESIAYGELNKAMSAFYFAVSKLEEDEYSATLAATRDDEMGAAEFHLGRLHESCRDVYRHFWQELHAVRQMCEKSASDTEKKAYWLRQRATVNGLQAQFEECYLKHHRAQPTHATT